MAPLFFQHPVLWWHGLNAEGRLAALAVLLGGLTLLLATWYGIHTWWRRWKERGTEEGPPSPDA